MISHAYVSWYRISLISSLLSVVRTRRIGFVDRNAVRFKVCICTGLCTCLHTFTGVDHPQGEGNMIHQECPVQVTWIVPYNLKETPYVLLTCVGTHNHPLTPPNKLVKNIAIEIYELITRINDPLLTSGTYVSPSIHLYAHTYVAKFRIHPLVKEWKELQNVQSIEQIHNALNTTSRLDAMIRKIRTVWWPNGRDINTVVFMMEEDRKRGRTVCRPHARMYVCLYVY